MVATVDRASVRTWRPRGGRSLTVPDGSTLAISGDFQELDEPWFTEVRFVTDALARGRSAGDLRMVQTGPVGTIDGHVVHLLQGDFLAEYSAQGGSYLLAATPDRSAGLVAWRGRWHEVYCMVNVPDATHAQFLAELDGLVFTDTPGGLRIRLQPGLTFERLRVTKHVPEVGFCTFARLADVATGMPRWAGARVRSGEVWRQSLPEEAVPGGVVVLHATSEVLTTIHPLDADRVDAVVRFVESLTSVRWSPR